MKKLLLLTTVLATMAACGEKVQVPPAYEGKILTKNGYKPDTVPPSIFRLETCFAYCDKLVLIEKSDNGLVEQFKLFMPKDQLNVTFDLRMTASIKDGQTDAILNRITPQVNEEGNHVVGFQPVYETYARPIIRDAVRSVVAEFTINEIASSRDAINTAINKRLKSSLSVTPIALKTVGLADIQFPEVITKQKEMAARRKIEIERQEAEKQIQLIKIQTELEKAKADRAVRRERAQAAAEENKIAADSVTEAYLNYKRLEVLSEMAKNPNAVFVPFEALGNVGLSQKVFNNGR